MDKRIQRLISAGIVVRGGKIQRKDVALAEEILQEKHALTMEVVEEALKEVQTKTEEQIEIETAWKWAARAVACFLLYRESNLLKWYIRAEDLRHEALEHAALARDGGQTVIMVESEIDKNRLVPKELEVVHSTLDGDYLGGKGHEYRTLKTLIEKDKTYRLQTADKVNLIQIKNISGDNITYENLDTKKMHSTSKSHFQTLLNNGRISVLG